MAENVYECLFILDSNRYARDPNGVAGQIGDAVEKVGGTLLVSRLWEEKKLAYPINGQRKGTYWLTYFRLESEKVGDFNLICQRNDNIVRNLTVKVEPRLVDALVAHAKGERVAEPEPEAAPAKEESKAPADA